jgi:hypothetical protein
MEELRKTDEGGFTLIELLAVNRGYPELLRPALLAQSIKLVGAGPEAHSVPSAESAA